MVNMYFGFPRSGKTTNLVRTAYKVQKSINSGKSKYKYVLTNIEVNIPGVIYYPFEKLGDYNLEHCYILIDEASIYCDSRDYKTTSKKFLNWLMLHGHGENVIDFYAQIYNAVDIKIRNITETVYFMYKPFLFGLWFTKCVQIPHSLHFPEEVGDIIMGYKRPPFFSRLFAKRIFRPLYYKFFDSHSNVLNLPPFEEYLSAHPESIR